MRPAPTIPSLIISTAREAAGRLLEVAGDGHPRQMTISRCPQPTLGTSGKQNSAYGSTSSSPRMISRGLLVLRWLPVTFSSPPPPFCDNRCAMFRGLHRARCPILVLPVLDLAPPPSSTASTSSFLRRSMRLPRAGPSSTLPYFQLYHGDLPTAPAARR